MDPYDIVKLCFGAWELRTSCVICKEQKYPVTRDQYLFLRMELDSHYCIIYLLQNVSENKHMHKTVSKTEAKGRLFRCIRAVNHVLFGMRRLCRLVCVIESACQTAFSIRTDDTV